MGNSSSSLIGDVPFFPTSRQSVIWEALLIIDDLKVLVINYLLIETVHKTEEYDTNRFGDLFTRRGIISLFNKHGKLINGKGDDIHFLYRTPIIYEPYIHNLC